MLAELDPLVTQRRYSPENKKQRESSQRFAGWWVCGASTYWYQSPELSIIPRFLQPLWSWRSGKEPVGLSFPPQRNKKPLKQCRRRGERLSLNFGKLAVPAPCRGDFNRTWMPVRRFWEVESHYSVQGETGNPWANHLYSILHTFPSWDQASNFSFYRMKFVGWEDED